MSGKLAVHLSSAFVLFFFCFLSIVAVYTYIRRALSRFKEAHTVQCVSKTAPILFYNNVVECQPISMTSGTLTLNKFPTI